MLSQEVSYSDSSQYYTTHATAHFITLILSHFKGSKTNCADTANSNRDNKAGSDS
jgi:hypothetical protein